MNPWSSRTVAIIGASRGLGRGAAEAFSAAGADVVAVARDQRALEDLASRYATVRPVAVDATQPGSPDAVITEHQPDVLVLVAGITPPIAPIHELSWTEFSATWETDVKLTHLWLSTALTTPMRPGSRVIVISSGASLSGSPRSGGYPGAKAMQRFMATDAQVESDLRGLGITFTSVLPKLTPLTLEPLRMVTSRCSRQSRVVGDFVEGRSITRRRHSTLRQAAPRCHPPALQER